MTIFHGALFRVGDHQISCTPIDSVEQTLLSGVFKEISFTPLSNKEYLTRFEHFHGQVIFNGHFAWENTFYWYLYMEPLDDHGERQEGLPPGLHLIRIQKNRLSYAFYNDPDQVLLFFAGRGLVYISPAPIKIGKK